MAEEAAGAGAAEPPAAFVTQVTECLRKGLNNAAATPMQFQLEVNYRLIQQNQDVLYIDRTGAGKSETYFITTKLLRRANPRAGPVIVVTPLVALIHDQVRRAKAFGLRAFGYFSEDKGMTDIMIGAVLDGLEANKVDLLYMTAEMLHQLREDTSVWYPRGTAVRYTHKLLKACPAMMLHPPDLSNASPLPASIPLLVVDEIHYIAEAGHDFRLNYAAVWSELANHPWFRSARKLGLTATVTKRVRASLEQAWPGIANWSLVLGQLYRDNISIRVQPKPVNETARVDYVRQLFLRDPSAYILVFCKMITEVKQFSRDLADILAKSGVSPALVAHYYSPKAAKKDDDYITKQKLKDEARQLIANEAAFRKGTVHVLFSTCALGLGYDKSDIHHVVHLWTPNSLVQYYQEFGRAGRSQAGIAAIAHLLPTAPWNPTGWVAVLSDICWSMVRQPNHTCTMQALKDRGGGLRFKESDVNRAIELGLLKKLLTKVSDTEVRFENARVRIQEIDKLYSEHMQEDVEVMNQLAHNGGQEPHCLWNFVLANFECQKNAGLQCDKCSGLKCSPGGDIAASSQGNGFNFYRIIAPQSGVPVLALAKIGDELRSGEERVKEIFMLMRPSMVMEPPGKWTICPLPDSSGKNVDEAYGLAEWLNGMEVSTFIQKNPRELRTVTDAKSAAERRDILRSKFDFVWDRMPTAGNVLLYDDKVSSGDTIDAVVAAMRSRLNGIPMEFAALTKFVFTGSKSGAPVVHRINTADKVAHVEQPAQQ